MERCNYHDDLVESIHALRGDMRELTADLRNMKALFSETTKQLSEISKVVAKSEGSGSVIWKMLGIAVASSGLSVAILTLILKIVE